MTEPLLLIVLGICAVIVIPIAAISVHGWLDRRRNRRMNRRRQDRHQLL